MELTPTHKVAIERLLEPYLRSIAAELGINAREVRYATMEQLVTAIEQAIGDMKKGATLRPRLTNVPAAQESGEWENKDALHVRIADNILWHIFTSFFDADAVKEYYGKLKDAEDVYDAIIEQIRSRRALIESDRPKAAVPSGHSEKPKSTTVMRPSTQRYIAKRFTSVPPITPLGALPPSRFPSETSRRLPSQTSRRPTSPGREPVTEGPMIPRPSWWPAREPGLQPVTPLRPITVRPSETRPLTTRPPAGRRYPSPPVTPLRPPAASSRSPRRQSPRW